MTVLHWRGERAGPNGDILTRCGVVVPECQTVGRSHQATCRQCRQMAQQRIVDSAPLFAAAGLVE